MLASFTAGYATGLSLIAAIGAQNAFVLRQGLRREHVGPVVAACALSDALLILAGVTGMGAVETVLPGASTFMRWLGVAFLIVYGALRFRAALKGGEALRPAQGQKAPLKSVLLTCLLLTWANPHVYLDTLVLIGALSAAQGPGALAFGWGAMLASFTFFAALGYGARLLAPLFARERAWVWLEIAVALTMWTIAATLAYG